MFYKMRALLKYLCVFSFFLIIFAVIQFSFSGLLDTDPYYHIRHAVLYRQGLSTENFPWVRLTPFLSNYTDLWYGYHKLLSLFMFGNLVVAAKFFIAAVDALLFVIFYGLLRYLKIHYSFFWTVILFVISPAFLGRLFLLRPHVLDIIFFLLGLLCLFSRRYILLGFIAFVFAITHQLAPLFLITILVFSLTDSLVKRQFIWQPMVSGFIGMTSGIALHPNPLMYLYGIYLAFVKIPLFSFLGKIGGFGSEIRSMFSGNEILGWLTNTGIPLLLYLFCLFIFLSWRKQPSFRYFIVWILTSVWLVVAIIIIRGWEFFVPLVVLLGAMTIDSYFENEEKEIIEKPFFNIPFKGKCNRLVCFLLIGLLVINVLFVLRLRPGFDFTPYEKASEWLKQNTPQHSVVFLSFWHLFPYFFYNNQSNWYTTAHDPIFLYEYDPKLYWLWYHLVTDGKACEERKCKEEPFKDAAEIIKNRFGANYVVIEPEKLPIFAEVIKKNERFNFLFSSGPVSIYEIQ